MSRADNITAAGKKNEIYSDFLSDLVPHPVTGDIVKFTNENAIIKSVRNLLLTDRGERLYQPNIGSDIRKLLFEPMADSTGSLIEKFVTDTIKKHEPRAMVTKVVATPVEDKNLYVVTITFITVNIQQPTTFNITLERVR